MSDEFVSTEDAPALAEVPATPAALDHAAALGVDVAEVRGSGKDGRVTKPDVEAALAARPELSEPAAPVIPEVETSVNFDQASGKYLVSVSIHHPDATVIAVNGRAVWEGQG